LATGLAWTDVGGELLTIEAAMMPGKGRSRRSDYAT
jgi:ATP-dependent Lon protease